MKKIGGNINAQLQTKTATKSAIGVNKAEWKTVKTLTGFLDFMSGGAETANYNAKIQESTHVFICDYEPLNFAESEIRLLINGKVYDVQLVDNPMELNYHLEFYLKYIGD